VSATIYKKAVLAQFGIPNLSTLEYKSNVHLAPGYLAGYARARFPCTEFVIAPRIYTDVLTEQAFIEYVVSQQPDLITFSLYLWNIEKSLRVVKVLRGKLPYVKIIFGGPEVNPDNRYLMESDQFTEGIVGEGEIAFCDYLAGKSKEQIAGYLTKSIYNDFSSLRKEYSGDTNPYLEGLIETTPDSTMFFETVRGCPFSCNFCYYNKVYDNVVPVGHEHIGALFEYARANNFDELFILDPTFNVQPNFDDLLDRMIDLNADKYFEISTELRSDFLKDEQISKLSKMNLVEAEIGLQSTNGSALSAMNRKDRTAQTIERTQRMIAAGISCKVDLIVGLPGDTLDDFKQSVDDVCAAGIGDAVQVFRLSILSGTEYSLKGDELGLQTEPIPPYYLQSTPTFSESDIREALDYAEEVFETSLYPIPPYLLSTDFSDLSNVNFIEFDSEITDVHKLIIGNGSFALDTVESEKVKLCESLVVHFVIDDPAGQGECIICSLKWLAEHYPQNTYQFIIDFREEVDVDLVNSIVQNLPRRESSYLDRDAAANLGFDLNLSIRLAVIVPVEYRSSDVCEQLGEQFDLFLHLDEFNQELIDECFEDNNLFFSGDAQTQVFNYLKDEDLLDDFTLFESYKFEQQKDDVEERIYAPNVLNI